ncbi:hypothetical protein RI129_003052 [Pyrocoelia pectoralis]|uniref:DDE Tnp4 domain-containing protein n=1 Tax=Pyrocoelia pectoralis TaxID=417401 RepID=A0AAN7VGB8_9COLE
MQTLAWTFNIGLTTTHKIVHETCQALWDVLSPEYLKSPESEEAWLDISEGFNSRWNFPHRLGSIDGKHINIQAPAKSGSLFFNYKKTFSIVLLASCDYKYKFTFVDIGAYGSQSDGGVFKRSIFGQRMEQADMNIPPEKPLPGTNVSLPYFFVADEAFPLTKFIMRPYPGKNLTHKQRVFNYRLSRARQVIENTFGILVARWRILKTSINAKVENIDNIVKAVVVLHNYCQTELSEQENIIYCPQNFVDSDDEQSGGWRTEQDPLQSVGRLGANVTKRYIYSIRDALSNYFTSDQGRVSWQDRRLYENLM